MANPATVVQFDGELIGPTGLAGLAVQPARETGNALTDVATTVNVNAGSAIAPGSTVVAIAFRVTVTDYGSNVRRRAYIVIRLDQCKNNKIIE
jgi:hypothetical protein